MNMSELRLKARYRHFGGWTAFYRHDSQVCQHEMAFSIYLPPQAEQQTCPVLYYLSGLTCTEENFMIKAGAQRLAAEHGLILVAPDTSPRNTGIPGEDERYDFGSGAGFYVNATRLPWARHYRMYDYVADELPALLRAHFPVLAEHESICGHSMGGHGALILHLRNPGRYRSVSAFAPICHPSQGDWGRRALQGYLGDDPQAWMEYDATEIVRRGGSRLPILIDQGLSDEYYPAQLGTADFAQACDEQGVDLRLRLQPEYDHSYYFIATFIADHLAYHAAALQA